MNIRTKIQIEREKESKTQMTLNKWIEKALHTHLSPLQHYALKRPKPKINTPIPSDFPSAFQNTLAESDRQDIKQNAFASS